MESENFWNLKQHLGRSSVKISMSPVYKNIWNSLLFVGVKDVLATVICKKVG